MKTVDLMTMVQGYVERTYNLEDDIGVLVQEITILLHQHGMDRIPIMDIVDYTIRQLEDQE